MQAHPDTGIQKRLIASVLLTSLVLVAELAGGWWTGSLALLSDAGHVFTDILALGLSYLALRLSALPADDRHTYGFHRLEVFAALINGLTLGFIALEIFAEAWARWQMPQPIKSGEMMIIAVIGLVVNLIVAFVLGGHAHEHEHNEDEPEHEDLNMRSAYLHVLGDAISSIGVIVAGAVLWFTGWTWVDPLMSVFIGALIVLSSWRVLRSAVHILIEGVPEHLSLAKIGQRMTEAPGVLDVHDLHVWSLCSGHIALSAHVVLDDQGLADTTDRMHTLKERLHGFGIEHTTIQFECAACGQGRPVAPKVMASTGDSSLAPGVAPA